MAEIDKTLLEGGIAEEARRADVVAHRRNMAYTIGRKLRIFRNCQVNCASKTLKIRTYAD